LHPTKSLRTERSAISQGPRIAQALIAFVVAHGSGHLPAHLGFQLNGD
jgi:hypothetical protein